jgi:hypothetical protein
MTKIKNSMTKHSISLRKRTSDAWNKKNIISKAIKLNKNKSEDMQLLDQFESIKAPSNKERLRIYSCKGFKL